MHRRKHGREYDAVPGGTVEPGEVPETTAVREILEETGLRVDLEGPLLVLENAGRQEFYFRAVSARGEAVLGGPEAARNRPDNRYELEWVPVDALAGRPLRPEALRDWMAGRTWEDAAE